MTPQERRALLGDDVIEQIHADVDNSLAAFGIPPEAITQLRLIFGPVVKRAEPHAHPQAA